MMAAIRRNRVGAYARHAGVKLAETEKLEGIPAKCATHLQGFLRAFVCVIDCEEVERVKMVILSVICLPVHRPNHRNFAPEMCVTRTNRPFVGS